MAQRGADTPGMARQVWRRRRGSRSRPAGSGWPRPRRARIRHVRLDLLVRWLPVRAGQVENHPRGARLHASPARCFRQAREIPQARGVIVARGWRSRFFALPTRGCGPRRTRRGIGENMRMRRVILSQIDATTSPKPNAPAPRHLAWKTTCAAGAQFVFQPARSLVDRRRPVGISDGVRASWRICSISRGNRAPAVAPTAP